MDIQIFNTLSGTKETFKPINEKRVGIYTCGPTVYDSAHIGNLRSYVFSDTLRRVFEYNNFEVKQVINITDVGHLTSDADSGEDKMSKAIKREGKAMTVESMIDIGTIYFEKFKQDLTDLNIETPSKFPRASDHIKEDIEIVSELEKKAFVYKLEDGIYFDTSKFPSYGKLGKIPVESLKEGARVNANKGKKSHTDFALWKFDNTLGWESPWGKGFPGWHIECSAMSRAFLGQPFDIHTGGVDHISIHHNNEIAQSEAAYSSPLANYWMHNEFLNMNDGKMSKSAGTFITLNSLKEASISPLAYRYWLLTAHYRSPIAFSLEAVRASQNALIKLMTIVGGFPQGGKVINEYRDKFLGIINDDLNTAAGIALVWEIVKDSSNSDADKKATIIDFDKVLGLNLSTVPEIKTAPDVIPAEIQALMDAREEARKEKDWAKADALREEIEARGFVLKDTPNGPIVLFN